MKFLDKLIEYGLYLFIFLLPWQTRWIVYPGNLNEGYWEYGTYSLYGTDVLFLVILLLALGRWVLEPRSQQSRDNNQPHSLVKQHINRLWQPLLLTSYFLLLYSLFSIWWAPEKKLALYYWLHLAEGVALFWLILRVNLNWYKLSMVIVISALIQAGFSFYEFSEQEVFASKWLGMAPQDPANLGVSVIETPLVRWLRPYGSLPHPNILAGFLVVGLYSALGWYLRLYEKLQESWQKREVIFFKKGMEVFLAFISFILILSALLLTFSRSAWIALLLSLAFLWGIVLIKKKKALKWPLFKITLAGTFILLVFSLVFAEPLAGRLNPAGRLEIKSHQERLVGYEQAFKLIKTYWYRGVSLGNYTVAIHDEIAPDLPSWEYQPVHNIYLLVLAELGVIGLLIFILYTLYFILYAFRHQTSSYSLVFLPLLPAFLLIGLFDHYLWSLHFGVLLFWLALGLSLSFSIQKAHSGKRA